MKKHTICLEARLPSPQPFSDEQLNRLTARPDVEGERFWTAGRHCGRRHPAHGLPPERADTISGTISSDELRLFDVLLNLRRCRSVGSRHAYDRYPSRSHPEHHRSRNTPEPTIGVASREHTAGSPGKSCTDADVRGGNGNKARHLGREVWGAHTPGIGY